MRRKAKSRIRQMAAFLLSSSLFLSLLVACHREATPSPKLLATEHIIERNPDSALAILSTITPAELTQPDHALYYLFLAQARYKNYQPVPPDSLLAASESYFRHHQDIHHLCTMLYYRAMTLYESGNLQLAVNKLKEGETLAEALSDDSLQSKYYESLCMVNDMANLNLMMLKYAKKFLNHSISINNPEYIARGLTHVSTAYTRLGLPDSSMTCLLNAYSMIDNISNRGKSFVLANLGIDYYDRGELETAEDLFRQALAYEPRQNAYLMLGKICWAKGQPQQAKDYWDKALKTKNEELKVYTLREILKTYQADSDYKQAFLMLHDINVREAAIAESLQTERIAELQYKYDGNNVAKKYAYDKKILLMVIGIMVLLIVCIYFWQAKRTRLFKNRIEKETMKIHDYEARIELLKESEVVNQKAIDELKKQIVRSRQNIRQRLSIGHLAFQAVAEGKHLPMKDDAENCLIEFYSVMHSEDYQQLTQAYHELSPRLTTYLILQSMGKTDSDISEILCISPSSVRSIKSRVKSRKCS